MAVSVTSSGVSSPFAVRAIDITDLENTGLNDFVSSSTTVYSLDLDNSANGAVTYFKLYDNASPTYGTTQPSLMIQVPASTRAVWTIAKGLLLTSGFSVMASTDDGEGAAGAPGSSFNVSVVCT